MAIKVGDIEKVTVRIFDYVNNPKIEKDDSVDYFFNPQHRDGNPNKSQWTILCSEELDCFRNSWKKYWNGIVDGIDDGEIPDNAYGVLIQDRKVIPIGIRSRENTQKQGCHELYIAHFEGNRGANNQSVIWHGYPADYLVNSHDIPSDCYLREWKDKNLLTNSQMNKIRRGLDIKWK